MTTKNPGVDFDGKAVVFEFDGKPHTGRITPGKFDDESEIPSTVKPSGFSTSLLFCISMLPACHSPMSCL
eukprot:CAMPEP_0185778364 /NCGR_PEP_ID=MMETSP1174-20130828/92310_1 /TAXON_ID=35687 /ORGANISM="Dictyocha speculum, Strain CCMP1381" /LENGTH=69 /DNA_ID=CAMNT_0028467045 /DNA_START=79 /DNA_END=288 /DNA_ORIENTATION=+